MLQSLERISRTKVAIPYGFSAISL